MDKSEIIPIFNEVAKKLFSEQEEKHKRRKKYKEPYCCNAEEVDSFIMIFDKLLSKRETMDYDKFMKLFKGGAEKDED